MSGLDQKTAAQFARLALGHVAQEYPNKLDHVLTGDADVLSPRALHPCFFGSYDWHSCVHGWWTLLTLRRTFPQMEQAAQIAALADDTFTAGNLAAELAYAQRPASRGFERPYGWGWLLYLHREAERHDEPWATRMEPLARHFADMLRGYLDILTYPVTVGTHYNTAFALVLAREWAQDREPELVTAIDKWSNRAFASRTDYQGWEPSGDEFLSPALIAALLMSKVMQKAPFDDWLGVFLPTDRVAQIFTPVTVSDRSDGKVAHLDGLNLSRAWCLKEIAGALAPHAREEELRSVANLHLEAALPHVTGDYMGEHWLASFGLLALRASQGQSA